MVSNCVMAIGQGRQRWTYVGNTAVSASGNLGLVSVDEDLGVAERATATVTADDLGLCPANMLSVNEIDSGIWLRLDEVSQSSLN